MLLWRLFNTVCSSRDFYVTCSLAWCYDTPFFLSGVELPSCPWRAFLHQALRNLALVNIVVWSVYAASESETCPPGQNCHWDCRWMHQVDILYIYTYIYLSLSSHLLVYLDIFFLVPSHPQCPKNFSLQWHSSCQHIDISVPRAPPEAVEGLVLWSFFTPLGGSPPTIWLYFRWGNMGKQWEKTTMLIHWFFHWLIIIFPLKHSNPQRGKI